MDDELTTLLLDGSPPVGDLAADRAAVHAGVRRARRTRRVGAALGAAAVVALVAGVLVSLEPSSGARIPVVGESPTATPTTPADDTAPGGDDADAATASCTLDGLPEEVVAYVTRWSDGAIDVPGVDRCVLRGRPGPAPTFDTGALGAEQALDLAATPTAEELTLRQREVEAVAPAEPTTPPAYPVLHLGESTPPDDGRDAEPGASPSHLLGHWSSWRFDDPLALFLGDDPVGGLAPGALGARDGVGTIGRSHPHVRVSVVVGPATSVVAVALDGEPVVWQRPVARLAQPVLLVRDRRVHRLVVRELAADGTVLATHRTDLVP